LQIHKNLTVLVDDSTGLHAYYSSTGAALFISAPGGDAGDTNVNHIAASVDGGCDDGGQGTSYSCPVVSGVIALMLEARQDLGWRDVQGILAKTARKVTDDPDNDWVTNAAGINHSYFYGFGVIDAHAAVTMAKDWELYGPEEMLMGGSGMLNLPLIDDSSQITASSLTIASSSASEFIAESVVAYVYLRHFSRGDLTIVLTSPHGTESILIPGNRPENTQLDEDESWKMLSVRTWGEDALGEWKIEITDDSAGSALPCADKPWAPPYYVDGCPIECWYEVEAFGLCSDGTANETNPDFGYFLQYEDQGLTFLDACCECGGGVTEPDYVDELIQWRLVVYGRSVSDTPTDPPTDAPSAGPFSSKSTGVILWVSVASIVLAFIVG
jgi:hypothetical protein